MAIDKCDICKEKMGVSTVRLHKCGWVSIQSGERLNGIQEVSGSIPLISTKRVSDVLFFTHFHPKMSIFYAAIQTMSRPILNCSKSMLKSMCSL